MRWIAHDESVEYKTFLLLNKAQNIYDIENALQYFHGPAQNFAYATKQGDIGLTIAGKFPINGKVKANLYWTDQIQNMNGRDIFLMSILSP